MARRYINTAKFNPYSFSEMWEPAKYATDVHKEQLAAFSELGAKSAMLGDLIDKDKDPEDYAAWVNYTNNLRAGVNDLMSSGLSTNTLNRLQGSTIDYYKNIKPIEVSLENKQKFAESLQKVALTKPNSVFVKDVNDYNLRDYRSGVPMVEFLDLDAIKTEAAQLAQVSANDLVRMLPPEQYSKYLNIIKTKYGYTSQEVRDQLVDPESNLSALKQMLLESNGAGRLLESGKQSGYDRLNRAIDEGLYTGAVGKTNIKLDDTDAKMNLQWTEFNERRANNAFNRALALQKYNDEKNAAATQAQMMMDSKRNALVPELRGEGKNQQLRYNWGTAEAGTQSKDWQNGILGMISATSTYSGRTGNAKGKDLKVFKDAKGNETKLKVNNKDKDQTFAIAFDGRTNGNPLNGCGYAVKWNGEQYWISPENLGLPRQMITEMEALFGKNTRVSRDMFKTDQEYSDYSQLKNLISKWQQNPDYVDSKTKENIQSLIDNYTIAVTQKLGGQMDKQNTNYQQKPE